MLRKNTASQKWVVFAFGDEGHANPGEPITGDALNITANLRLDGGVANAIDDTNPTELEDGYYVFDLTQAETNADNIVICPASATANVNVIGIPGAVWTAPAFDGSSFSAVPWNASWDAEVQSEVNDALVALNLDHLMAAAVAGTDVADDSVIARLASSAATADWDTFDHTTDALQALRDRGDAAWVTGGGGSISDIVQWKVLVPEAVDLANTKVYRLAIALTNQVDDLPTTGEITPGTISIDRAAQGGASWTSVVADAACSEAAGLIYYDEVFDTATGYESGDMLRITFKGQKVTVSANDYEITDGTNGIIAYSGIVADTPDVNVARINGVDTNVAAMNLFFSLLNGSGQIQANTIASNALASSKFPDGFLTAAKFAAGAITAIQNGLATEAKQDTIDTVVDAIKAVTDLLPDGGALTTLLNNVAAILTDTGTTLPATLSGIETKVDTVDTVADGIKAKTDSLTFTKAGEVDSNVQSINGAEITGDGQTGTEFDVV